MNIHERLRLPPTRERREDTPRERTPEEREDYVQGILAAWAETFAALAWTGYQLAGRGVVLAIEEDAAFCPRADLFGAPGLHSDVVVRMVDDYDPETQVAVVLLLPQTPDVSEEALWLVFSPEVPPPQVTRKPRWIVTKDEPRH